MDISSDVSQNKIILGQAIVIAAFALKAFINHLAHRAKRIAEKQDQKEDQEAQELQKAYNNIIEINKNLSTINVDLSMIKSMAEKIPNLQSDVSALKAQSEIMVTYLFKVPKLQQDIDALHKKFRSVNQ